jgi:hypothetical protein
MTGRAAMAVLMVLLLLVLMLPGLTGCKPKATPTLASGSSDAASSQNDESTDESDEVSSDEASSEEASSEVTSSEETTSSQASTANSLAASSVAPSPTKAATPTSAAGKLFTENFESGASRWTTVEGTWGVVQDGTSVYRQSNRDAWEAIATAGDVGWTDYSYSARFKLFNGYCGILGRVDANGNMYLFDFNEYGYSVWAKYQEGWSQILPDVEFDFGADKWHNVKIRFAGNQITLFIDGTQMGDPITNNLITSGKIGVRCSYGTFAIDDIVVE